MVVEVVVVVLVVGVVVEGESRLLTGVLGGWEAWIVCRLVPDVPSHLKATRQTVRQ